MCTNLLVQVSSGNLPDMASTGMIIDGVLGSSCVDSSGEVLDVDGADILDLEEGRGVLNYEHKGAEEKDSNGQEIVGKITYAHKIMKESDCENARQRKYWKQVKHPYIYGVCRLYDGAGHEGAKALAAQIRDHVANEEPILVRFSVEGSTLEKDGNVLKRSVIRRVALTLKPCNRTADSGLLEDPNAPEGFAKKPAQSAKDILAELGEDAKKFEHPGYMKLGGAHEVEYEPFEADDDHRALVKSLVKLRVLRKALAKSGPEDEDEDEDGYDSDHVYHHMLETHDDTDPDWVENVSSQVERYPDWALRDYPIDDLQEWAHDKEKVARYSKLPGHTAPPIVALPDISSRRGRLVVLDGNHRVAAARARGEATVRAYTPSQEWLKKTLTAGMPSGAPSSLTGGAALQREDLSGAGKVTKKKAMAVLKSYLGHVSDGNEFKRDKVKDLLKCSLPEASDEYIDHFADIAEDYHLKLQKADGDDPYPKLNTEVYPENTEVDRASEPKGVMAPRRKAGIEMQRGGALMLPPPGKKRVAGQAPPKRIKLQQHFPEDDIYKALLNPDEGLERGVITPEQHTHIVKTIHDPWHRAMGHWLPLNNALREGKVPRSIMAKSVIFAAMSPNTSVPKQERYYGYYMDMLHEGLVDPFKPISEEAIQDFTARSARGGDLPKWNREYYKAHPFDTDGSDADDDDGDSEKGELPQIRGMRSAHLFYPRLEHLTAKYKDDTQGIAAELMNLKHQHETKNKRTHPHLDGYGPKLTRYLLGMMGGGNMIVPDRHMVRSTFDLQMVPHPTKANKFQGTPELEKLQGQVVTDSKNEPLLRAIDHNFFTKHPAVKTVLQQFPKHFQGREQQAIFPAFWLHWLAIGHHDRMRGRPSMAFNTDTDHGVFWDSVRDEMIKHGLHPHPLYDGRVLEGEPDDSFDFGANAMKKSQGAIDPWPRAPNHLDHPTWLKVAGAVSALRQRWGETPALFAYFSHLAPIMAEADSPVPPVVSRPHAAYHPPFHPHLFKTEALTIELKKALADARQEQHPALAEVAPDIHHVYAYRPGPDLAIKRHAAGRFTTAGNHLHILEDYHGDLGKLLQEGPLDEARLAQIDALRNSSKHEVVPMSEIMSGARPELWEAPAPVPAGIPRPPSSFDYHRYGSSTPDHLEFIDSVAHMNGHPLDQLQTKAALDHVRNGHAFVRYKQDKGQVIRKMEQVLERLMKSDDPKAAESVHAALGRLDELVRLGHLEPHHAEALRNHAFKDPMTGHSMGNKFAYTDFKNRADSKGGIHIAMDGNDFKSVNDKFGHEVGDSAIKSMGTALREAMDESVGSDAGKLFRIGGDEFAAHVPTHEHAAKFARALRNKLDALVPIQGTHRLSMGVGFGMNPEHADQALYEAKKQKYHPESMVGIDSRKWQSKYQPGAAPSFAHSLVPGFEGPLPLDQSQMQVKPPPAPQPTPPPPEPVIHTPPASGADVSPAAPPTPKTA